MYVAGVTHIRRSSGPAVRGEFGGEVVILIVDGSLSDGVDALDSAALFALAEAPRAVVIDVSLADDVSAPGALRRLALTGRHPRDWAGVPVAVAGLDRRDADELSRRPLGSHLVVTTTVRQALSVIMQNSLPTTQSVRLAPHPTAPRASRDLVSRALLDWRLSKHIPAACLIVSELVTNAMIHAGTQIEVTVSEHRQAVRLAVRDRSAVLPLEKADPLDEHGRGMAIVGGLSSARGVMLHPDGGKVVWAVLDAPGSTSPDARQAEGARPRAPRSGRGRPAVAEYPAPPREW